MKTINLVLVFIGFFISIHAQKKSIELVTEVSSFTITPQTRDVPPNDEFSDVPQPKGKYRALIIGVQDYTNNKLDLQYPASDAKALYNVLTQKYNFAAQNVTLLTTPSQTTHRNLHTVLKKLANFSKDDDVLIFFAGHGQWIKDYDQGYWLPSDAEDVFNYLSNDAISGYIKSCPARHVLLITDACFSGGIFKSRDASELNGAPESLKIIYEKYTCRQAMTSGALTTVPDKSIFMEYLLKRLESNTQKYMKASELFYSLINDVIEKSGQTPVFGGILDKNDDMLGDFIFIKK